MGSYLVGWLRGLIRSTGVRRTTTHTSPDGEIRGELAHCGRAGIRALANVDIVFAWLKPSPFGCSLSEFLAAVPDCTRGFWPWAAFPSQGAAEQPSEASSEEEQSCE